MKVFIKGIDQNKWVNLSEYVHPPFTIVDTVDGTENTCKIVFRFPADLDYFDVTKSIRPKLQIKITDAPNEYEENDKNTYFFYTSDNNSVRKRKDVNVEIKGVYEHIVNGVSYVVKLDDRYLPQYTITQPKTRYYDLYRKRADGVFLTNTYFSQDGEIKTLEEGSFRTRLEQHNTDNIINFGYDLLEEKHYVELYDVDSKDFNIKIGVNLAKTAPSYFMVERLINDKKAEIFPSVQGTIPAFPFIWQPLLHSKMSFLQEIVYYKNGSEIDRIENILDHIYEGGGLEIDQKSKDKITGSEIISFPEKEKQTFNIDVKNNSQADKVRVYFSINSVREEKNLAEHREFGAIFVTSEYLKTNMPNVDYDDYVKTYIESIDFSVVSSAYEIEQHDKYTTLHNFVEKAIFDYNFNNRHKVRLSSGLKPLLDIPAKESEWVDYTLKELLIRVFKYVGIAPVLREDFVIDYIAEKSETRYVDLEQQQDKETEILSGDFYDKIVSNAKNLVGERDFVKEILTINSGSAEFDQINNENASYTSSNDIYYVSNAILHTPGLEFEIGSETITSNIGGEEFKWDITKRFFEKDIYNSFADARIDDLADRLSGEYFKGNTLYYVSGSNIIGGLGHQAPDRNAQFIGIESAEYAIIEMLIILALEQASETPTQNIDLYYSLKDFIDYTLELTYVPYYKELRTKFISNMHERSGLNYEKKVNVNEKVISYDEMSNILTNEMERKGNVLESYTEIHDNLSDTLDTFSVINDDLWVTTKNITVMNNYISVDYTLQRNYIHQNEDVRLPVAFERYAVPYEYVNREIFIENHLIFSSRQLLRYRNDPYGCNKSFVERILKPHNERDIIEGLLYSKVNVINDEDSSNYLMRMTKLENRFSMILNGKFLDNYSAGTQRYDTGETNIFYSQALPYVKWNGKSDVIKEISIGFNSNFNTRLELLGEGQSGEFDFAIFPDGKNAGINVNLYNLNDYHLYNKDAREGISLNYTTFLTTEDKHIKWYSFKPVTHIGYLLDDVVLKDNLNLDNFDFGFDEQQMELDVDYMFYNEYKVTCDFDNIDTSLYNKGIVFLHKDSEIDEYELVGVLKEPYFLNDKVDFYVYTTRYGKLESKGEIERWQGAYVELGVEIKTDYSYNDMIIEVDSFNVEQSIGVNVITMLVERTYVETEIGYSYEYNDNLLNFDTLNYEIGLGVELETKLVELGIIRSDIDKYYSYNDILINDDQFSYVISLDTLVAEKQVELGIVRDQIITNATYNDYLIGVDSLIENRTISINMYDMLVERAEIQTNINVIETINDNLLVVDILNEGVELVVEQSALADPIHALYFDGVINTLYDLRDSLLSYDSISETANVVVETTNLEYTIYLGNIDVSIGSNEQVTDNLLSYDSLSNIVGVGVSVLGIKHVLFIQISTNINTNYSFRDSLLISDSFNNVVGVGVTTTSQALPPPLSQPDIRNIDVTYCEEITFEICNISGVTIDVYKDNVRIIKNLYNRSCTYRTFYHTLNGGAASQGGYYNFTITYKEVGGSNRESSKSYSVEIYTSCLWK